MKKNLIWFRNDLRTQDNRVLCGAREGAGRLLGVYCLNPRQLAHTKYGFRKTGKYRARFLLETLEELRDQLKALHIPLLVYKDSPELVIPEVVARHNIDEVHLQYEWTSEERAEIAAVRKGLQQDIRFVESFDQFLFHPDDIPFASFGQIPEVFTTFRKKCEKYARVRNSAPPVEPMPVENYQADLNKIPSLEELGYSDFEQDPRTAFPFKGGETHAWERLNDYFWNNEQLSNYKETRNGLLGTDYSSKFAPWLANGSISARSIYWQVQKYEKKVKKNSSTYWMIFELIWRDYFKFISLKHGNKIFKLGGILERDYPWKSDKREFVAWSGGDTPYRFVNANMNELAATGWMSNRGRQNVASYWAKERQQDWRIGAAYFESMLIDYDVHSNWGNWMYNSGVGNDPRDRRFNIELQATRYDPDGAYQEMWTK